MLFCFIWNVFILYVIKIINLMLIFSLYPYIYTLINLITDSTNLNNLILIWLFCQFDPWIEFKTLICIYVLSPTTKSMKWMVISSILSYVSPNWHSLFSNLNSTLQVGSFSFLKDEFGLNSLSKWMLHDSRRDVEQRLWCPWLLCIN